MNEWMNTLNTDSLIIVTSDAGVIRCFNIIQLSTKSVDDLIITYFKE